MSDGPAHARRTKRRTHWWIAAAAVVVALGLVGGGVAYWLVTKPHTATASAPPVRVIPKLSIVSVSPPNGSSNVAASAAISVQLSTPLATGSPMPTLSPAVGGTWSEASPTLLEFVADGPLVPGSSETLTVPGQTAGLLGSAGQHLPSPVTSTFSVASGSILRLQELLAQLGYLPLSFVPTTQPTSPRQEADPQEGTFNWRWANQPASLTSLWAQGQSNVILRGAVMSFESQHSLTTDGIAGPEVWTALLQAAESGASDPQAYGYVYVSKDQPETTTVYQNGAQVYQTLANTGVAAAPTADGTFPVYSRFVSTTMSGTNPDGTKYKDPDIPWVSYFNGGDALHGFDRASYGFPQSNGCVEMPPANAAIVFPLTPIGTLVTIQ